MSTLKWRAYADGVLRRDSSYPPVTPIFPTQCAHEAALKFINANAGTRVECPACQMILPEPGAQKLGEDIEQTELTRSKDTVDLGGTLPKVVMGAIFLGMGCAVMTRLSQSYAPQSRGPDAIDEMARESRRVMARNAQRRARNSGRR